MDAAHYAVRHCAGHGVRRTVCGQLRVHALEAVAARLTEADRLAAAAAAAVAAARASATGSCCAPNSISNRPLDSPGCSAASSPGNGTVTGAP